MLDLLANVGFMDTLKLLLLGTSVCWVLIYIMDEIFPHRMGNKFTIAVTTTVREILPWISRAIIVVSVYHLIIGTICMAF